MRVLPGMCPPLLQPASFSLHRWRAHSKPASCVALRMLLGSLVPYLLCVCVCRQVPGRGTGTLAGCVCGCAHGAAAAGVAARSAVKRARVGRSRQGGGWLYARLVAALRQGVYQQCGGVYNIALRCLHTQQGGCLVFGSDRDAQRASRCDD
jgi:hypothetical protein